jgi:hypothetical protein
MIIFGWKTRLKTLATGKFYCRICGGERQGRRVHGKRWFTIFFIPAIPYKDLGQAVICQTCGTYLPTVVLDDNRNEVPA